MEFSLVLGLYINTSINVNKPKICVCVARLSQESLRRLGFQTQKAMSKGSPHTMNRFLSEMTY